MGELQPLRGDLPEPVSALAARMRELFKALDISLTRFSARVHVDKSNVSRYFSGHTGPPWQFVHQLMVEATLVQPGLDEPTQEVFDLLFDLHRKAQVADDSPAGHVTRLRDQLARADVEVARAQRNEQQIKVELANTRRQIAELKVSSRELESRRDRDAVAHHAEVVVFRSRMTELLEERERLFGEIDRLARELDLVESMRIEAERECRSLESELEAAERRATTTQEELSAFAVLQRERAEQLEKELEKFELKLQAMERTAGAEPNGHARSSDEDRGGRGGVLHEISGMLSAGAIQAMRVEEAANAVYAMSPYDAATALKCMDPSMQEQILQRVPAAYRQMIVNRL